MFIQTNVHKFTVFNVSIQVGEIVISNLQTKHYLKKEGKVTKQYFIKQKQTS